MKGNEWALHIWASGPTTPDEEFILAQTDDPSFSVMEETLSKLTPVFYSCISSYIEQPLKLLFLSFSNSHKLANRLYDYEKFSAVVYFEGNLEQVDLIKISYVFYRLLFDQNTSVLQVLLHL